VEKEREVLSFSLFSECFSCEHCIKEKGGIHYEKAKKTTEGALLFSFSRCSSS